jgi:hypothetical protein
LHHTLTVFIITTLFRGAQISMLISMMSILWGHSCVRAILEEALIASPKEFTQQK